MGNSLYYYEKRDHPFVGCTSYIGAPAKDYVFKKPPLRGLVIVASGDLHVEFADGSEMPQGMTITITTNPYIFSPFLIKRIKQETTCEILMGLY